MEVKEMRILLVLVLAHRLRKSTRAVVAWLT
jgi:hypothetical protein